VKPELKAGASILVGRCASAQEGESVVVVCDAEMRTIGDAVRDTAGAVGAEATLVVPPPRTIDNEEPAASVAAAILGADVVFLSVALALAHTRAVREAIASGARVVSMTAFTERMMREGGLFTDFVARRPLCQAMARRLAEGTRLRVANPAGTDVSMSLEGSPGNSHACIVEEPGFTAVPNIEANTAPAQGSAEGTFVVDGSIPYYGVGVVREPVTLRMAEGFVTAIEGGDQARFLAELLAAQDDPWVYNVAQFAFGLNPDCRDFTGEMLNDEGVNGTVHVGVGTSANLGGTVSAKTHFDAIIRKPTVWIDDEVVVEDGEVTVEAP
jgi:leucyl aminopeptidase (aminopeptidase T)